MCGIIAYAKGVKPDYENVNTVLDSGLKRLSYRGYSWGTALSNDITNKSTGEYPGDTSLGETDAKIAVGHVRWATHGEVNTDNAHPHESCDGRFAVVHNGVIENWEDLKENLKHHDFQSETDTEVIAHYIEGFPETENGKVADALHAFDREAEGNYAIVVMDREEEMLYALKRGSPLVFGYEMESKEEVKNRESSYPMPHSKGAYFASDLYALSDKINQAFFMEDGDIIKTSGSNLALMRDGEWLEGFPQAEWKDFEWTEEEPELGDKHRYWMEKEIKEQPKAMRRLKKSLADEQREDFLHFKSKIEDDYDDIVFVASGTSYHATLLGTYYLQPKAQTIIASEFDHYNSIDSNTLVIAVSQSGETRDVLNAMQTAREQGAEIACLVNVPHSTIQRKADFGLEIKAQQENCVAATKTFANQVYALMHLARCDNLEGIPKTLETTMNDIAYAAYVDAQEFYKDGHEDIYIIGNASTYPLAREIALKLKEISYIHAEGMMAGELKHGTLALIEEGTPVIALDNGDSDIQTSVEEVEARGGRTKIFRNQIQSDEQFIFQATTYGFFLALYWAHMKNLPVDRPRNLAKSVTVK